MKLGILADVHEEVDYLARALAALAGQGVERLVLLGDLFRTGTHIARTVELLAPAAPVGVWGNHDFGLCSDPDPALRARYGDAVLDFLAGLRPELEVEGCLFTHVEPWLDPTDVCQLWYYEGPPDTPEKAARSFDARPQRLMFVGHYHSWGLWQRTGRVDWDGKRPLTLAPPQRYLIAVGALCEGRYATFDTATSELLPHDVLV
jgi:hypothetical protein